MTHGENISEADFELLLKTSETFAEIRGTQIHLFIDEKNSYIGKREEGRGYRIAVADSNDGVKHITFLEHELSHMMFNSPVLTLQRCLGKIISETPEKNPEWKMSDSQYKEQLKQMAMQAFNIIEDERIESNWGAVYEGTKSRFGKAKEIYGHKNCTMATEPSAALFNARMNRVDLIPKEYSHIKEMYIDNARETGTGAGIVLAKKFWNDEMIPWIKDMKEEPKPKPTPSDGTGKPTKGKGKSGKGKGKPSDDPKKKVDEPTGKPSEGEGEPTEPSEGEPTGAKKFRDVKPKADPIGGSHEKFREENPEDEPELEGGDLKKFLEDSKKKMSEEIKDIKEKIEEYIPKLSGKILYPLKKTQIVKVERPTGSVNIDRILSRGLNTLFRAIQGKYHDTIDIAGGDIDTEELLQARLRRDSDFFIDEVMTQGVSIVIGIDCSGSMGYDKMQQARDFCGTLYKAIDGIDNVDLKVVAWSSPNGKFKLSVTDITKFNEVKNVAIERSNQENANHMAHQYLETMIRKDKADVKLIMMLTDGVPQCDTEHHDINTDDLVDLTTKAVGQSRQHGIRVLGLYVGDSKYDLGKMKQMYGQDFINVSDMEGARQHIIFAFKKYVVGAMRAH